MLAASMADGNSTCKAARSLLRAPHDNASAFQFHVFGCSPHTAASAFAASHLHGHLTSQTDDRG